MTIKVQLAGAAREELVDGSGYGLDDSEPEVDRRVRAKLEESQPVRAGFGTRYPLTLEVDEAISLAKTLQLQAEAKDPGFGDFSHSTQKALFNAARVVRAQLPMGTFET